MVEELLWECSNAAMVRLHSTNLASCLGCRLGRRCPHNWEGWMPRPPPNRSHRRKFSFSREWEIPQVPVPLFPCCHDGVATASTGTPPHQNRSPVCVGGTYKAKSVAVADSCPVERTWGQYPLDYSVEMRGYIILIIKRSLFTINLCSLYLHKG